MNMIRAPNNVIIFTNEDDYNLALELRLRCLGKYDGKVADSHFSLARVYAKAPNRVGENEGWVDKFVSTPFPGPPLLRLRHCC